jgi:uncharacterized membrane protein
MGALFLAAAAFVGTHFLMSHPLRAAMVARLGPAGFQGVYSLISLVLFGLMLWIYRSIGDQQPLWLADEWLWLAAALVMWFASILLVGSFTGNPALPGAPRVATPAGVLAITRHPMMWSFALWAAVHAALMATPKALILDGALLFLALAGSVGQDKKKRKLMGERWHEWTAQTAFMPFGRGVAHPGWVAVVGGTLLFVIATWLHPLPVGIWRWFGLTG